MSENDDLALFVDTARNSLSSFMKFLLQRERKYLRSEEPDFVRTVEEVVSNGVMETGNLPTEVLKSKLKSKPTEWVKLMQETSDVKAALRQLELVTQLVEIFSEEVKPQGKVENRGEWIQFCLYAQVEIIYLTTQRISSGLNRTRNKAKKVSSDAYNRASKLKDKVRSKTESFQNARGRMIHKVNFAQSSLVNENRFWEVISLLDDPVLPNDILFRTFESRIDSYVKLVRDQTIQVSKILIELYPEWESLVNSVWE